MKTYEIRFGRIENKGLYFDGSSSRDAVVEYSSMWFRDHTASDVNELETESFQRRYFFVREVGTEHFTKHEVSCNYRITLEIRATEIG